MTARRFGEHWRCGLISVTGRGDAIEKVWVSKVALTSGEFDLLCAFALHAGRVLSRDFLPAQTRLDQGQQVVEVVRHAAGQLAHAFRTCP